jgi:hypothetical protein
MFARVSHHDVTGDITRYVLHSILEFSYDVLIGSVRFRTKYGMQKNSA